MALIVLPKVGLKVMALSNLTSHHYMIVSMKLRSVVAVFVGMASGMMAMTF